MISLKKLVQEACPELGVSALPDRPILGLECDSRKVGRDFVFVAIRGVKADGAQFVREALERGAVAVIGDGARVDVPVGVPFLTVGDGRLAAARLAAVFYGYPAKKMKTVAVTGTNGKTTTSYLFEHILKAAGKPCGVIGTVSYRYAGKDIPAVETTPGPLRLQEMLAEMVAAGCGHAVMETSSHALDQRRTAGIDFDAAVFTNLTQDHLDYHGTLEKYFEAKARLFLSLGARQTAVLNADDAHGKRLCGMTRSKVLTYGVSAGSDLAAANVRPGTGGTTFDFLYRSGRTAVDLPLIGSHNVLNALAAVGAAAALGFDPHAAAKALGTFSGVPGRLESIDGGQEFGVYVDFAHTPDGLENVLRSLQPYKRGKLILVFGCGGDRDRTKRPRMAAVAAALADSVIVTSDNPRSENPRAIADEIVAGFPHAFPHAVVLDRRKAIRQALLAARAGDIVILAGKGHERTQIVGAEMLPFSDREEAERVLRGN